MLIAIVAKSFNDVIGKNNSIPWEIKEDLAFFKQKTLHHYILMGRKTYESLPKILVDRKMIVLSRTLPKSDQYILVSSLQEAIDLVKDEDLYICGGAKLYEEALAYCDLLYVTQIFEEVEGDTYFPKIPSYFKLIDCKKGQGNYEFQTYLNTHKKH